MSYLSKNNSYRISSVNSLPITGEERVIYKLSGSSVINVWDSGSVRQVVVVQDETNSNTTSFYTFDGSNLIQSPQSVLDRLTALEYVPLSISTFTNNVNNVEKGSTVTSITFNYSYNKTPTTSSINNSIGNVLNRIF